MSVNIFILDFLKQFENSDDLIEKWESDKNQRKFKRIIKGVKTKDPLKPKRGKSGFLFFCDEKRPELLMQDGNKLSVKEIVSKLGSMWQELKNQGKTQEYEKKSEIDRNRYHDEMKQYKQNIRIQKTKSAKKIKTKKNNPFDNFLHSKKPKMKKKYPEKEDSVIIDILKEKWKKLSLEKRSKYEK